MVKEILDSQVQFQQDQASASGQGVARQHVEAQADQQAATLLYDKLRALQASLADIIRSQA